MVAGVCCKVKTPSTGSARRVSVLSTHNNNNNNNNNINNNNNNNTATTTTNNNNNGKLFESCLYPVLDPFCTSHANQFDFVANGGTNKALFAEQSTVDYFYDRGLDVVYVL